MKKLLIALLLSSAFASAQVIPNASFESWVPYAAGLYNPQSWMTSDSITQANAGGSSVYQGSDAYDGAISMHLKSTQIIIFGFPITGPGIATNGIITLVGANFQFSGGSPDTARSRYLTGYYKYSPKNAVDAGVINVYLFRNVTGTRDTIAAGTIQFTDTVDTYTNFIIPIHFRDWENRPDTSLIIIQSSKGINDPDLAIGSELVIDSISFSGFVGIEDIQNSITSVNVYPSPSYNELNIDVATISNAALSYEIFNSIGSLVLKSKLNSKNEKIDISKLSEGNYILKIADKSMRNHFSKNFTIAR